MRFRQAFISASRKNFVRSLELRRRGGDRRTFALVALSAVSVLVAPVATVAWVIAFDATGLAGSSLAFIFTIGLPAVTVAVLPTAIAGYWYDTDAALKLGVALVLTTVVVLAVSCARLNGVAIC